MCLGKRILGSFDKGMMEASRCRAWCASSSRRGLLELVENGVVLCRNSSQYFIVWYSLGVRMIRVIIVTGAELVAVDDGLESMFRTN